MVLIPGSFDNGFESGLDDLPSKKALPEHEIVKPVNLSSSNFIGMRQA